MPRTFVRCLILILTGAILGTGARTSDAKETLVFVAAFASGNDGAIYAYQLDLATGRLTLAQRTGDVENPFFLALSPDRKFLYSIHAPGQFGGESPEQVAAYEVVGRTGRLKLLNRQSTRGSASCYVAVDATGKTLVLANYGTGSVASLPIRQDGSLGEIVSFMQHEGTSIISQRQGGPHAHCAVISPDNRFVYAADLGLDRVMAYRLDAPMAKLSPSRPAFVRTPPGLGPRHLTFHPNGRHIYVINELANSVTLFDYDAEPGILDEKQTISTLPEGFSGTSYCADVKITPNGRFLYGTNRGHDSIAEYRIGDDGTLTLVGIEPSLGVGPQNLAITPDGQLLLCANMPGNNVVVFRIDQQTGGITPVGEPLSVTSPACILIP
jgi:6-phosphogluconolactonase